MIPTTPHKSARSSIHWADFACCLSFFTFIPSSPFAPSSPITHSPSQFSLSVLTPSPSSLHHSASFPCCSAPYFCPPSSPRSLPSVAVIRLLQNGNTFSSFLGFLKTAFPSHSFVPLWLCFSALVRPSVIPRPGRVMNVLFYGESQVHPSLHQNRP